MDASKSGGAAPVEDPGVDTKPIVGFGVAFAVLTIGSGALVAAVFFFLEHRAVRRDDATAASEGLQREERALPPGPLLQVHPERHWQEYRAAELAKLDGYGWTDRASGEVHIPIERAMDAIAKRGVAPLASAPPPTPFPTAPKETTR